MALNNPGGNVGYGFNNALQLLAPLPISANRAPTSADIAQIGQLWIYNNQTWIFTSGGHWNVVSTGGGSGALVLDYTAVSSGMSPYTVTATDTFLGVSASAPTTILLPNAPATGTVYIIKDVLGTAHTDNITVTTVGGVVDIDGATSYVMNTSLESAQVLFNGTEYLLF